MPAKLDDPTSLRFLYCCMSHSNYSTIDYNSVGRDFNIKPPAARMRFTRLREALDPDLLNKTKLPRDREAEKKRKREKDATGKSKKMAKEGYEPWRTSKGNGTGSDADDEEDTAPGDGRGVKKEETLEDDDRPLMWRLRSWAGGKAIQDIGNDGEETTEREGIAKRMRSSAVATAEGIVDRDAKFEPVDCSLSVGAEDALQAVDEKPSPADVTVATAGIVESSWEEAGEP